MRTDAVFAAGSPWAANRDALLSLPRRQVVLLAADWAEGVLHLFESTHPGDDRPRRAVEAARSGDAAAASAAYSAAADSSAAADAYADAYAAAYAAAAAASAYAYAAAAASASAASAAAYAVGGWAAVHARWLAAWHGGRAFDPAWRTPLAVELARDPADYPYLLDHLADLGADVDDLRGFEWARSNWAVYHLTEDKP